LPRPRDVVLQAWIRLKSFIFGAGKIIVIVVMCLAVLASVGSDGSVGNQDSDKSVLSVIGKAIVPVFEPIGLKEDNWPAAVGIFTGVFAKEAVVGTLDSLYGGLDKPEGAVASETAEAPYSLIGGLGNAVRSIPENFAGFASFFTDPFGMGVIGGEGGLAGAAETQDVDIATFGAMVSRFDGAIGAFAYLLFVLLYFPCAAALGAVANEIGRKWALFAALWTTGLGYFAATLFYQVATFTRHPQTSAFWIAGLAVALGFVIAGLRAAGRRNEPAIAAAEHLS